ncbi:MAG: MaoC family dehydratase N-terminal domain-containing protein [Dehalococcoidia bacterium]
MAESVVTEEMKGWLNKELNRVEFDVEKVLLRRYTEAVEDPNPRWKEVMPPNMFTAIFAEGGLVQYPFETPQKLLDGGGEWEFFAEARLGDKLTGIRKIVEYREKEGKLGHMLFVIRQTEWTNQRGELVARNHSTSILY